MGFKQRVGVIAAVLTDSRSNCVKQMFGAAFLEFLTSDIESIWALTPDQRQSGIWANAAEPFVLETFTSWKQNTKTVNNCEGCTESGSGDH